jgi:hypothetical protein
MIRNKVHPDYVEYSVESLLKQYISAIAAGYEDVNDHDFLCDMENVTRYRLAI